MNYDNEMFIHTKWMIPKQIVKKKEQIKLYCWVTWLLVLLIHFIFNLNFFGKNILLSSIRYIL